MSDKKVCFNKPQCTALLLKMVPKVINNQIFTVIYLSISKLIDMNHIYGKPYIKNTTGLDTLLMQFFPFVFNP